MCFKVSVGSYKYHDGLVLMHFSTELSGMYDNQETANFLFEQMVIATDYYNQSNLYMGDYFTEHYLLFHMTRKYQIFLVTLYLPSVSLVALRYALFCHIFLLTNPSRKGFARLILGHLARL